MHSQLAIIYTDWKKTEIEILLWITDLHLPRHHHETLTRAVLSSFLFLHLGFYIFWWHWGVKPVWQTFCSHFLCCITVLAAAFFAPSCNIIRIIIISQTPSPQRSLFTCYVLSHHLVSCDAVQTDEARRWVVHQRVQQTPRTALSAEVPGVSDREAGQVGDLHLRRNRETGELLAKWTRGVLVNCLLE